MDALSAQRLATAAPPEYLPGLNRLQAQAAQPVGGADEQVQQAQQVQEAFTSFVGETFFSQMIGAMRSTVGKPAYFHGGQGEEIFRGQLDQQLAQELTESSADRFAEPLFANQFPHLAKILREYKQSQAPAKASQRQSLDLSI